MLNTIANEQRERLPRRMTTLELCRVELISETKGDGARPVQTFKATNADGSVCDLVVTEGPLRKTAYCSRHEKHDDCEGAARLHCSIDFAARGIERTEGPAS